MPDHDTPACSLKSPTVYSLCLSWRFPLCAAQFAAGLWVGWQSFAADPSQGRGYRQPVGRPTQSGSPRRSCGSRDSLLGTTDTRSRGKSVGAAGGCGSRCWPDPGHPSGAEGQGSWAGLQWCIWIALCLQAGLRQRGRGERWAWLICSSKVRPLGAPPIGSRFPRDVAPLWYGGTLLRGASEGFPGDQGVVGQMFSPTQPGAPAW